jgi:hypothetical protein
MEMLVRSTNEIVYMPSEAGIIRSQRWWGITLTVPYGTLDATSEYNTGSVHPNCVDSEYHSQMGLTQC